MNRRCFVCKNEIESDRLEAIPQTRLCTQHGHAIQKFGGEFIMSASQERTSKKTSLKVNYGAISTSFARNERGLELLKEDYDLNQLDD